MWNENLSNDINPPDPMFEEYLNVSDSNNDVQDLSRVKREGNWFLFSIYNIAAAVHVERGFVI